AYQGKVEEARAEAEEAAAGFRRAGWLVFTVLAIQPLGGKDRQVHAIVAVHAQSPEEVADLLGPVEAGMGGYGIRTLRQQDASRIVASDKSVKEHFGFKDGFGQPALDIDGYPRPFPGQGTPDGHRAWKPVALGEFILGQADEQGVLPEAPQPPELAANGTYLVYRKLQQHVGDFRNYVAAQT